MDKQRTLSTLALTLSIPLFLSLVIVVVKTFQKQNANLKINKTTERRFSILEEMSSKGALEDDRQPETWNSLGLEQPLVIVMVGLPARGKSYIVKMMIRYLRWTGFESEVFNVGSHRRSAGMAAAASNFFDSDNKEAQQMREKLALEVQESMYLWLKAGEGPNKRVAIFDATNTTRARRHILIQRAKRENVFLLFVESICDDKQVLERNYQLKLQNDDYKGMDPLKAKADFLERVRAYEKVYESIADDEDSGEISYIKLINVGQKVITSNCTGYLPSQVAFYLQNVHIKPRRIYLCIRAQTEGLQTTSGPTSGLLTEAGRQFTMDLAKYIQSEQDTLTGLGREMMILTGSTGIHSETVLHLRMLFPCYNTPLLNELRAGSFHGLTKKEFQELYPDEFMKRERDKLNYRYPGAGGESYQDLIERIRPIIIELERQRRSVVVCCHLAVFRCIYAYFLGTKRDQLPFLEFKEHHVYKLTPGPFGCSVDVVDPSEELYGI